MAMAPDRVGFQDEGAQWMCSSANNNYNKTTLMLTTKCRAHNDAIMMTMTNNNKNMFVCCFVS